MERRMVVTIAMEIGIGLGIEIEIEPRIQQDCRHGSNLERQSTN
jgi:hypothetical protein